MKKIIMVVLMVALFAGAVGVGVHVMNREAMADVIYVVFLMVWDVDEWVEAEGFDVQFNFGGDWQIRSYQR